MQSFEDESIHSCVDDPPYALGFMGKSWDTFKPKQFQDFMFKVGKEKLRILKPGGYNLSFGGTRTYHRLVCGLEDAGFMIKGMIMWCYGNGFPKSLDISKAIDNYYGLEREKVILPPKKGNKEEWESNTYYTGGFHDHREAISKEAQQWDGWGTGLKPALEPIVVAQKPYEKTYAENVLKHGVGGINIDGCRINYTPDKETDSRVGTDKTWGGKRDPSEHTVSLPAIEGMPMYKNKGRFPSNLILTHHPECKLIGSKEIKGNSHFPIKENWGKFHGQSQIMQEGKRIKNETIQAYDCHPDCPIRLLDEQSGECKTGAIKPYIMKKKDPIINFLGDIQKREVYHQASSGGASRFFYCGKAYKTERNAGLQDIQETTNEEMVNRKNGSAGIENPRAGAGRGQGARNNIATLKPINVMRYLVRLVTPPNGLVLDCFAGSGTTGIACIIEGFNYILVEKRKRFANTIIPKRLEFWRDPKNWSVLKDHNALPKIKTLKNKRINASLEQWIK